MSVLERLKGKFTLAQAVTTVAYLFRIPGINRVQRMWGADNNMDMQNVGPHILNSTYIAMLIAQCEGANTDRVNSLTLIHDFPELRGADRSWDRKQYVTVDDFEALKATVANLPHYEWVMKAYLEFKMAETLEAKVAHDAEKIEPILEALGKVGSGDFTLEDIAGSAQKIYNTLHTDTARDLLTLIFFTERPPRFALLGWQQLLEKRLDTPNPLVAELAPKAPA